MFRIVICDDEAGVRKTLCAALGRFARETGQEFELLEFGSADALLEHYPEKADLLLLDIYMPGVDGMAAARKIRSFDSSVCMIFITTMYQRAIEGYAVRAFGFIKKPVSYAELCHEVGCALQQIASNRARKHVISIHSGGTAYCLEVDKIWYCEVQNHSMSVHTSSGMQVYRCQMKKLEEQLAPYGFFRCHASYLVNSEAISRIDVAQLTLKDGTVIPISQRRRKEFLAELSAYVGARI